MHRQSRIQTNQAGIIRNVIVFGVFCILLLGIINTYRAVSSHADEASPEIASSIEGSCLDDHHDGSSANSSVDAWKCNGSPAQNWSVNGTSIKHAGFGCLDVQNNGVSNGSSVVLSNCDNSLGEIWSIDLGGYENPNSGLCLTVPGGKIDTQLIVSSCNNLSSLNEGWSVVRWSGDTITSGDCGGGTEGQKVACYAQSQWSTWQAGVPNHKILLGQYSSGNAYEEWCADFVSYVYKEAGYPFSNGERNGWDEYDANNIQNMGFTKHLADGYVPKPGDIAFFDYPGGHVEIVVVGGKTPTFIYGDSGTTDPTTNNGEMNEDMLTNDGSAGQITYYLSPN